MYKAISKTLSILAALLACILAACGSSALSEAQEAWAKEYMAGTANFTLDFNALPQSVEEWQAWQEGADIGKLSDSEDSGIGENRLGTLAGAYSMLAQINVVNPGSQECRQLFEELTPYFEKAFAWSGDTTAQQCLDRLKSLSEETVMAEIDELAQRVSALYEAEQATRWFTVTSDGNLQIQPEEYVSSYGDMQAAPREYVSSDSDLQVDP